MYKRQGSEFPQTSDVIKCDAGHLADVLVYRQFFIKKNADASVHGSQGDLMLCDDCEQYRFPYVKPRNRKRKELAADAQRATHQSHGHTPQVRDVKAPTEMAHTSRANIETVSTKSNCNGCDKLCSTYVRCDVCDDSYCQ